VEASTIVTTFKSRVRRIPRPTFVTIAKRRNATLLVRITL
jgi:hypothetical protein